MAKAKKPTAQETTQVAILGDCVKKMDAKPPGCANLIIADPPYDFGMPYEAYSDNLGYDKYMAWTKSWLTSAKLLLHEHGSLCVFCPEEWDSEIDMFCRHELKLFKRRKINWIFTFGQKAHKNFTRSACYILYYTKARDTFTFNTEAVKVASARQLVYKDKRAVKGGKPPDSTWMLLKEQMEQYMLPDTETWLVSRICGTYKERNKHMSNQIPLPIMERLVLALSNRGDLVIDPFCGSGSSAVPCAQNGRFWEGYDIGKNTIIQSNKRIAKARREVGLDFNF